MPERGGPTTQSGILYQNSVAALYLGRLCDSTLRPNNQSVIHVRVEAITNVDDIVITFADEHKAYIQAKEDVGVGDDAWQKLWRDFDNQFQDKRFSRGKDRLLLVIGNLSREYQDLGELCQRAKTSEDYQEWLERLTKNQWKILEKIKLNLSPELLAEPELVAFLGHVDVDVWPLDYIERDLVPHWMPSTNISTKILFRLFRDRVGGKSRIRDIFKANELRESLVTEDLNLEFSLPLNIEQLRLSLRNCSSILRIQQNTFANTDTHIKRAVVDEIINWLMNSSDDNKNVAMLIDQAGMGKTVTLRDVLEGLEDQKADVLAIKADHQLSGVNTIGDIQERLDLPLPVYQIVEIFSKVRRVVVLVDQIDALSLSLAHDQKALNIALELIARLRLIPNVRILLSCRVFDRNSDPRLNRIELAQQFTLSELPDDDVASVLDELAISWKDLTQTTQKLLRIPLHLNLFTLAVGKTKTALDLQGLRSLQELYALIWQNVILKQEPNSPNISNRIKVIQVLTDYMNRNQSTSAPQSLFHDPEYSDLASSMNWLASTGIIYLGKTEWTFLHQTFFDYCYARDFVVKGNNIVTTVLESEQGLFIRPQLIQVVSYLRGTRPPEYLRDLNRLLNNSDLRYHIYDLILRWFCSLPDPFDGEWILANRLLLNPQKRVQLITRMYGNSGWFNRLGDTLIPTWLEEEDELDNLVIPYLESMSEIAQAQVIEILRPYLGRSDKWDNRLANVLFRIRKWHTGEAIDLFEQITYRLPKFNQYGLHELAKVAEADPVTGVRLIRFLFDHILNQYLEKRDQERAEMGDEYTHSFHRTTLYGELHVLENSELDKAIEYVSKAEPALFAETMIPWLENALLTREGIGNDNKDHFYWDEFCSHWYEDRQRPEYVLVFGLIHSIAQLTNVDPNRFRVMIKRLAKLPFKTPQQIIAHIYCRYPHIFATEAYQFLMEDQRRLNLGDSEQYESRQLLEAIYPHLSLEQRGNLENQILKFAPLHKHAGVEGLRWRGLEQLFLLQAIPSELLSENGRKRLREWEYKFPGVKASDKPRTSIGGFVGSPIPDEIARKMTDRNWLNAMNKYKGGVDHRDFLKGGAPQLSTIFQTLIKENPERYYNLIQSIPEDVDDAYIQSILNGLAESTAPVNWLYEVIRKFAYQDGRDIKRPIAWAIQKRVKDGIPDDLIDLLRSYLFAEPGEDEEWWSKGENHGGVYSSYLNSDRGSAFQTLMRIYDHQNSDDSLKRKWELMEFASREASAALRAGAIHELIYMIRHDRNRAIEVFEALLQGYSILIQTEYFREFIYWAFFKNYLRLQPYIISMMDHNIENVQEQGSQLACIAAISTGAMETDEARNSARDLAEKAITGSATWKRGAARIYSHNITGSQKDECVEKILFLLRESDDTIHDEIGHIFFSLKSEHIFSRGDFIEAYARYTRKMNHQFGEYLLNYGLLDPIWTLYVIKITLNNKNIVDQTPWLSGAEEFIRLVMRIYLDPTIDAETRKEAMDIFDLLMEKYAGFAQKVLAEWDQR
jgi:hypothetical protein